MNTHNIGRNAPCPCGSGKKYKKCCMGKPKVAFTNYRGQQAVYGEEAILAAYKILSECEAYLSRKNLTVERGLEILKELYALYNEFNKHFSPYYSCARGCTHCCFTNVLVSKIEAQYVKEFVLLNFSKDDQDRFNKIINQQKDEYLSLAEINFDLSNKTSQNQDRYFAKHLPCPFLSDPGDCLIYSARPVPCRTCNSVSNPEKCRNNEKQALTDPFKINDYLTKRVINISKRIYGLPSTIKHLPAWFIDGFKT